jgi:Fe-S cluster assembly iron-binding protein IscA
MKLTQAAVERLKVLVLEHPEDPIVHVRVNDLDDQRLEFTITLENQVHPDAQAQTIDDLTVAIPAISVARLDELTIDFQDRGGFTFYHKADQPK